MDTRTLANQFASTAQPGYHQPYHGGGSPYPPQQGYQGGGQPPYQGYGSPPPEQHHGYNSPPPSGPSGGPPMPDNLPPLPQGWIAQWDAQSSRYYYAEQATSRTQWERPLPSGYSANPPTGSDSHSRGHGVPYAGGHGGYPQGGPYGGGPYGGGPYGGGHYGDGHYSDGHKKEKRSGKSGMLMGAAGGLAVGAIGGALVANALGMY